MQLEPVVSRGHLCLPKKSRLSHAAQPPNQKTWHLTTSSFISNCVLLYLLASMIKPGVSISIKPYPAPVMKADVYTLVAASHKEVSLNCWIAAASNQQYPQRIQMYVFLLSQQGGAYDLKASTVENLILVLNGIF